jgi:hypothetical protein
MKKDPTPKDQSKPLSDSEFNHLLELNQRQQEAADVYVRACQTRVNAEYALREANEDEAKALASLNELLEAGKPLIARLPIRLL